MSIPEQHAGEFARFPPVLQQLVRDEIAAGNAIAALFHGFPAAPCGACILLAQPVASRPREATPGLDFHDRDGSSHAGEFTDATRHFFVLEPPRPPAPVPHMDALRSALQAKAAAQPAGAAHEPEPAGPPDAGTSPQPHTAPERFRVSMTMDHERWHDGSGYDLSALADATAEERAQIEQLLASRGVVDWRDAEALAALDTPRARDLLRRALHHPDPAVAGAVALHAGELLSDTERTAALVTALESARVFEGLAQALLAVEGFHPPAVVDALLRGLRTRDGVTAMHFAAMLLYVHGQAESAFDLAQRPFLLRFATEDAQARAEACRALRARIGVDPRHGD